MKSFIKRFLPEIIINQYHKILARLSAFVYQNPSEEMIVIGVTGTNGKSTAVCLIAKALEAAGFKVGATSTVLFKVAEREWLNDKKMTMLGRFQLQKLMRQMVRAGCRYAVIETSSQGIEQYRHLGINYDYVVFTNLTPEHIEAHGGFENYKKAKGKLFEHLTRKRRKNIQGLEHDDLPLIPSLLKRGGRDEARSDLPPTPSLVRRGSQTQKVSVVNVDDEHAEYFLRFNADKKIKFAINNVNADFVGRNVSVSAAGTSFSVNSNKVNLKLIGAFNVYNALPAIAIGLSEGLTFEQVKYGLENVKGVPGRMEIIDEGQPFTVIVDYAPEPAGMGMLYNAVVALRPFENLRVTSQGDNLGRIIHVLGSCGGGRDKARRPILGQMAGEKADVVIVTNEDPYDEDPMEIINAVAAGAIQAGKEENKNLFKILDRKEAIKKAIDLASAGDLVLVTGKGAEQAMAVSGGKYIPWDDRKIIREALDKDNNMT
ncbi:UDP-N-acetylmuramoyl-L-alanyl-D-glutamate--2,6-diaminopimelate ligase [Candidatus Falkowbacteria bacterium]|nr:UDP-N-acetylmuramoyl-L-alanyl-D-glutamate--2,6-diaminopimelate ligase [Candidatus Falkowbacteria bacterium]